MCLTVKKGCKPEIAQKDIVCYKCVKDHVKYWKPAILISNAMSTCSYPYNEILTAESYSNGGIHPIQHLRIDSTGFYITVRSRTIEEGFHAARSKTILATYPCIIPKGTEYCLGDDNDIVAVNMIVFRTYLDYYIYRLKKFFKSSHNLREFVKSRK